MLFDRGFALPDVIEPHAALIVAAVYPGSIDDRTVAKWSRLLRYAAAYKRPSNPLDQFIKRRGGINGCAGLFSRRLGRLAKTH